MSVCAPDKETKVEDEPGNIAGMVKIEVDIDLFLATPQQLGNRANGEFDRNAGDEDQEEIDQEGSGAPAEGGQRYTGKGLGAAVP